MLGRQIRLGIALLVAVVIMLPSAAFATGTAAETKATIKQIVKDHVLLTDGSVWRWESKNPELVKMAIQQVSLLKSGGAHVLALKTDGTVWAWGNNSDGQLGVPDNFEKQGYDATPRQVAGLANVVDIAAGMSASGAVTSDGTVWTWGFNKNGDLGDNTKENRFEAKAVPGLSGIVAIHDSSFGMFVQKNDGSIWGWGPWAGTYTPVQVMSFSPKSVKAIQGKLHTFVTLENGEVWAYGLNKRGQFGNGARAGSDGFATKPVRVPAVEGFDHIAVGDEHTVGLKQGTVYTWGGNINGALGDGNVTTQKLSDDRTAYIYDKDHDKSNPTKVEGLSDVVSIWADQQSNYALKADGTVWGWGNRLFGATAVTTPIHLTALDKFRSIDDGKPTTAPKEEDQKPVGEELPKSDNVVKSEYTVFVNGKQIVMDQPPVLREERVQVPLRAIFDAIGATIKWDGKTKTVTAEKNGIIIVITAGKSEAKVNGAVVKLDSPAILVNERMLVPVRFVTESFKGKVEKYDAATKEIFLLLE